MSSCEILTTPWVNQGKVRKKYQTSGFKQKCVHCSLDACRVSRAGKTGKCEKMPKCEEKRNGDAQVLLLCVEDFFDVLQCRQNTHSHDTFVHVQRITERTAQMFHSRNTRGSRTAHCSVSETICHPSAMSHMLPHLPQNTCTRSHLHHLSSDHLLPHCLVLSRSILDCSMKPCETHGGVADTLDLHLPHTKGEERWEATPVPLIEARWRAEISAGESR